jgi:hypothetical protein
MDQGTPTITIDGVQHELSKFSQGIQSAVAVYNKFQADLQAAQLEVIKSNAAVQSVANQITEAVKRELEEQAAEKPAEAEAAA